MNHEPIPADHPVQPLAPGETPRHYDEADGRWVNHVVATCGHCGLNWDDSVSTSLTPTSSARCPFEWYHVYDEDEYDEGRDGPSDDEWISAAYERQVPLKRQGYYDGGRLVYG